MDLHLGIREARSQKNGSDSPQTGQGGFLLAEPLGYLDFLCLMKHASLVITDSGGIQEETTCLGVPCITVRENTERPVTVTRGTNVIAGTSKEKIEAAIRHQMGRKAGHVMPKHWDGQAAVRIVDVLTRVFSERTAPLQPAEPVGA
jgi:UDP-N-acetylglucosamine 2-epimerase (non-hydrolysing)